jgi:agmatinase
MTGIIERTRSIVGDTSTYLSIDIDGESPVQPTTRLCFVSDLLLVLDPSIAPATGTPESGGWTMRELKRFIKGLEGVNLVGADVVEVSPPYDTVAEVTSIAAADLIVDILAAMVKVKEGPALKPRVRDEL